MWQTFCARSNQAHPYNVMEEINKSIETIPTKSMEMTIRPLLNQIIALLRQRGCIQAKLPIKTVSTDQTIHIVSRVVTKAVQEAKSVEDEALKKDLNEACNAALSSGESLCRFLTQQANHGLSPSSSQAGTDSGVEDIDEESGNEVFNLLSRDNERSKVRSWIREDYEQTLPDSMPRVLEPDEASSTRSLSDDDMKRFELSSTCSLLLMSVVTVATLADQAAVREITKAVDKVLESLEKLKQSKDQFMAEFTEFGSRLITLAHHTGKRQTDLRSEVKKARMQAARSILEKGAPLLLATAKIYCQYPNLYLIQSSRNHNFERIEVALKQISNVNASFTSKQARQSNAENIESLKSNHPLQLNKDIARWTLKENPHSLEIETTVTVFRLLNQLEETMLQQKSNNNFQGYCNDLYEYHTSSATIEEQIVKKVFELVQDFIESPHIGHHMRARMLKHTEALKIALYSWMETKSQGHDEKEAITKFKDLLRVDVLIRLNEIKNVLSHKIMRHSNKCDIFENLLIFAQKGDHSDDREERSNLQRFLEYSDEAQEIFSLACHCFSKPGRLVEAVHTLECNKDLTEQIVTSVHIVQSLPGSTLAVENLATFLQQFQSFLLSELTSFTMYITKPDPDEDPLIVETARNYEIKDSKKASFMKVNEQTTVSTLGFEIKLLSNQCRVEHSHWTSLFNSNHTSTLLCHIKELYESAWNVYSFTKGEAPLHTTADFFRCFENIMTTSQDFSRCSCAYLEETETACYLPRLHYQALSTAFLLSINCHRCQSLTSCLNAHNKLAVFNKVVIALRSIKSIFELVSKLTTAIHSILLKLTFLPAVPKDCQALLFSPRHRSLTPRRQTSFMDPSNSCETRRSTSRGRTRQRSAGTIKTVETPLENSYPADPYTMARNSRKPLRSHSLSHPHRMGKRFLTCVKTSTLD